MHIYILHHSLIMKWLRYSNFFFKENTDLPIWYINIMAAEIIKDIFTFWIVSWIWLDPSSWKFTYQLWNNNRRLSYIKPIPCLLMLWPLKESGHQQAWFCSPKPKYSISSIRRVDKNMRGSWCRQVIIHYIGNVLRKSSTSSYRLNYSPLCHLKIQEYYKT